MRAPLNLATRPFRNERLPNLGVALAAIVLAALTAQHVVVLARLLPGSASAVHVDVAAMDEEISGLRREAAHLRVTSPDLEQVRRWRTLAGLVDRRTFWWTALLSRLEDALPWDVRLVSISPGGERGSVQLTLDAVARSTDAALGLIGVLESRPEFSEAQPLSVSESQEGTEARYLVRYHPDRVPVPAASAVPDTSDTPATRDAPGPPGDEAPAAPSLPGPPEDAP